MPDNFLNSARVAELWAAIKTALAGKADLSALDGYTRWRRLSRPP